MIEDLTTQHAGACEAHEVRAGLLARSTELLGASLDVERTLDEISELLVPAAADVFAVALLTETGDVRPAAFRHADPALGDETELMHTLIEPIPGGLVERVLAGEPTLLVQADAADAEDLDSAETRACLDGLGIRSLIVAPLRVREEPLGVLCAARTGSSDRAYEDADQVLMDDLAHRAAQALDSASLFQSAELAEHRFQAAFENAPIGVAVIRRDADGDPVWRESNPALAELLGRPRHEIEGRKLADFIHPEDRDDLNGRLGRLLSSRGRRSSAVLRMLRPDGEPRHVTLQSTVIEPDAVLTQVLDITEQRRSEDEIERLTHHDPLTGLMNRSGFEEAFERVLAESARHGDDGAVALIDLDDFKRLNDTFSTAVGDEVLRSIGQALGARLRETDMIARLGDDEFGVLLPRTNPQVAAEVVDTLLEIVRGVHVQVGDRTARTTASAGVRAFGRTTLRSRHDLLGEADLGILEAKQQGRNRVVVVFGNDEHPQRRRMHMRWSERIRDALDNDRFVLYEQPIMRLSDGVVDRSEILIRMLDDSDEPIAPGVFLPVAEQFGLIQEIDRWVITNALKLLAARRDGDIRCGLSVNLSADSLMSEEQVDAIAEAICAADIDPTSLSLEITETAALGDLAHAERLAARLGGLGCHLALDDFGSGFSSFAYLRRLPVDVIKIDGQFVREVATSQPDQLTVRAIVDVAVGLGKETVAEFVEDEAALKVLRHLGVDCVQGYAIGRPVPARTEPRFEGQMSV